MLSYLIEYCNPNKFRAIFEAIEKAPEGMERIKLLVIRLPSDKCGVYARYHLEAPEKDKYMDIRFSTNSISIGTNCTHHGMSKMLDKLSKFAKGDLKTIDDAVSVQPTS